MAEEGIAGTQVATTGPVDVASSTTASDKAPEVTTGKPAETTTIGTTATGTQASSEDTFFDPASIKDKPELMAAYKNMQRDYGKKMEAIKASRQKVEAYDNFNKDPVTNLQNMAKRYGYSLTRAEAAAAASGLVSGPETSWEPKTWDEVISKTKQETRAEILEELRPIIGEVQSIRKSNIERLLDDNCPDWRQHEDTMMANLKEHPTLVKDPAKLYMMSVPAEVLESRATQKAIKKLQDKADSSQVAGASTTKNKMPDIPDKAMTFQESVAFAKKQLAERGIKAPA